METFTIDDIDITVGPAVTLRSHRVFKAPRSDTPVRDDETMRIIRQVEKERGIPEWGTPCHQLTHLELP